MTADSRPPAGIYAGEGHVRTSRDAANDVVRLAFSGTFTLGELGPIVAWAVGESAAGTAGPTT